MLTPNQACCLEVCGGNQPGGEELFRFWAKMTKFWKAEQCDFHKEIFIFCIFICELGEAVLNMVKRRPSDMFHSSQS